MLSFDCDCKEEIIDEEIHEDFDTKDFLEDDTNEIVPRFRISMFEKNPRVILEFTGLENYEKFKLVFLSLGEESIFKKFKYVSNIVGCGTLSLEDQLFLTLWKLRKNSTDFELSVFFGIHFTQVGNIFTSWIIFMSWRWSKFDIWPSPQQVQYYMPEELKKCFPKTRVIINGSKIYTQKSKNPLIQQPSFSYNKKDSGYLPLKHVVETRKLSTLKTNVKQIIGLWKTYKILSSELNHHYRPIAFKITGVCVFLKNFKECNIKNKSS